MFPRMMDTIWWIYHGYTIWKYHASSHYCDWEGGVIRLTLTFYWTKMGHSIVNHWGPSAQTAITCFPFFINYGYLNLYLWYFRLVYQILSEIKMIYKLACFIANSIWGYVWMPKSQELLKIKAWNVLLFCFFPNHVIDSEAKCWTSKKSD